MKNQLTLIIGSTTLLFISIILAATVSPAHAVDHGDNGGANYAGVEWDFAQVTSVSGVCGRSPCTSVKPEYTVRATVRNNGQVCNEQLDFSNEALIFEQKAYTLCGQPAIIMGSPGGTMRAYYHAPNGTEDWTDSPEHSDGNPLGVLHSRHYWYVNW